MDLASDSSERYIIMCLESKCTYKECLCMSAMSELGLSQWGIK